METTPARQTPRIPVQCENCWNMAEPGRAEVCSRTGRQDMAMKVLQDHASEFRLHSSSELDGDSLPGGFLQYFPSKYSLYDLPSEHSRVQQSFKSPMINGEQLREELSMTLRKCI